MLTARVREIILTLQLSIPVNISTHTERIIGKWCWDGVEFAPDFNV